MRVESVLRAKGHDVVTVTPEDTVRDAVATLHERRIGAALVVDATGAIAGIISERDVIGALAGHGGAALDLTVADVMTRDVVSCAPSDGVDALMTVMTKRRIRHLPVVADGNLVGIVSIGDVVKRRIDELSLETQALHEYITLGR